MVITEFLDLSAMLVPERTAIAFEGRRYSYAQLKERVNRLADSLNKLGLGKGERAAILEVNCNEYIEACFATLKVGGIFVPMNFRIQQEEMVYLVNKAEPKVLFVGSRYADMVHGIRSQLPSVKRFVVIGGKHDGMEIYDELIASGSAEDKTFAELQDEDIAVLIFTAGTTGFPKGVPQDNNAYSSYVLSNVDPPDMEAPPETNVLVMPLYHVAGMQALMAGIYGGRSIALMRQFDEKEWFETVQREKATRVMVVPTMLKRIVEYPDFAKYDLSSVRVITYGAAACPYEVLKKTIERFPGRALINAFGGTETSSTIAALRAEDQVITGRETEAEKEKKLKRLATSIGLPLEDVEIQVRDEKGKELPAGQMGEIVVRGPRIMKGYWKDEERTEKAFTADGWYRTGDLGYKDEEGYIYLTGRGDDVIVRGGENIGPDEVESVLSTHPKIEEVVVIGVKDEEWGQQVRAIVRLKKGEAATEAEIIDFCRPRLAGFKRPTSIIMVIGELPKTSTGKTLRRKLREKYGDA
ncbi:MAG: long-chain-fatty-acid--CoA ligase [Deltaproteobacteria bacterium]|nr:long-chain-fatty-acid--CoA ligase [Deltaproteobacteria bacterium]